MYEAKYKISPLSLIIYVYSPSIVYFYGLVLLNFLCG